MVKKIVKSAELEEAMGPKKSLPFSMAASGVIGREELTAGRRAQKLIAEAEEEANKIRGSAQKLLSQIEKATQEAKQAGFREGKEEGLAQVTEELLKARTLKENILKNAEADLIQLVAVVAEKVLGELAAKNKEAILAITRQALSHSIGDKIVVRMNPADLKRLKVEDLQFKDVLDRTKHIHVKEDDAIQVGGCVVETEIGTIDAQLETQLKAIRKALGV